MVHTPRPLLILPQVKEKSNVHAIIVQPHFHCVLWHCTLPSMALLRGWWWGLILLTVLVRCSDATHYWYGDYDDGDEPSAAFWVMMAIIGAVAIVLVVMLVWWCCCPNSLAGTGLVSTPINTFTAMPYTGVMSSIVAGTPQERFSVRAGRPLDRK